MKTEVKVAHLEADKAIEEYQKFDDFKLEVIEGCMNSYHLWFSDCKKKVAMAFSNLDLQDIVESDEDGKEEEDGEGEETNGGVRESFEVETGHASLEVTPGVVAKEGLVQGIIAKAMIDVEAMLWSPKQLKIRIQPEQVPIGNSSS